MLFCTKPLVGGRIFPSRTSIIDYDGSDTSVCVCVFVFDFKDAGYCAGKCLGLGDSLSFVCVLRSFSLHILSDFVIPVGGRSDAQTPQDDPMGTKNCTYDSSYSHQWVRVAASSTRDYLCGIIDQNTIY